MRSFYAFERTTCQLGIRWRMRDSARLIRSPCWFCAAASAEPWQIFRPAWRCMARSLPLPVVRCQT